MESLAKLTATLAGMTGAMDGLNNFVSKYEKGMKDSATDQKVKDQKESKLKASKEERSSQDAAQQTKLAKDQKNIAEVGFQGVQTAVNASMKSILDNNVKDAKNQRMQAIVGAKQAWDQWQTAKQSRTMLDGMLHMAQQNYVAVNQTTTEIIRFHGFMANDSRAQTKMRVRTMKAERHANLTREQRIETVFRKAMTEVGIKGVNTRSDLEVMIQTGTGAQVDMAKRVKEMLKMADHLKGGEKWDVAELGVLTAQDKKMVGKLLTQMDLREPGAEKGSKAVGLNVARHQQIDTAKSKIGLEWGEANPNATFKDAIKDIYEGMPPGAGGSDGSEELLKSVNTIKDVLVKGIPLKGSDELLKNVNTIKDVLLKSVILGADVHLLKLGILGGYDELVDIKRNTRATSYETNRIYRFLGKALIKIDKSVAKVEQATAPKGTGRKQLGKAIMKGARAGTVEMDDGQGGKLTMEDLRMTPKEVFKMLKEDPQQLKEILGGGEKADIALKALRDGSASVSARGVISKLKDAEANGAGNPVINFPNQKIQKEVYQAMMTSGSIFTHDTRVEEKIDKIYKYMRRKGRRELLRHKRDRREDLESRRETNMFGGPGGKKGAGFFTKMFSSNPGGPGGEDGGGSWWNGITKVIAGLATAIAAIGTTLFTMNKLKTPVTDSKVEKKVKKKVTIEKNKVLKNVTKTATKIPVVAQALILAEAIDKREGGGQGATEAIVNATADTIKDLGWLLTAGNYEPTDSDVFGNNFIGQQTRTQAYKSGNVKWKSKMSNFAEAEGIVANLHGGYRDVPFMGSGVDPKLRNKRRAIKLDNSSQVGSTRGELGNRIELAKLSLKELEAFSAVLTFNTSDRAELESIIKAKEEMRTVMYNIGILGPGSPIFGAPNSANKTSTLSSKRYDLSKSYNQGFAGINQFLHNAIDQEMGSGFMGFNPMKSMAHSMLSREMGQYRNPNNVTAERLAGTRAMMVDKMTGEVHPKKMAEILERFDKFVQTFNQFKKLDGKVINENDVLEETFLKKAITPGSIFTNDMHVTSVLKDILVLMSDSVFGKSAYAGGYKGPYDPSGLGHGYGNDPDGSGWGKGKSNSPPKSKAEQDAAAKAKDKFRDDWNKDHPNDQLDWPDAYKPSPKPKKKKTRKEALDEWNKKKGRGKWKDAQDHEDAMDPDNLNDKFLGIDVNTILKSFSLAMLPFFAKDVMLKNALKGSSIKGAGNGLKKLLRGKNAIGMILLQLLIGKNAGAYWKDGDNIADSLGGLGVFGDDDTRWGNSETMGSQAVLDMQILQYMKKNGGVPTGKKTTSEMLFTQSGIINRDRNYGMMPQMPADMARALQYSKTDNYQMMKNSSPKGMTKEVFDEMLRLYKNVWMPTENLLKKKYGKHADGTWNLGTKKLSNPYNLQQKGMLPTGMEFDPDDLTPIDHRLLQMMKNNRVPIQNLTPQMASGRNGGGGGAVVINNNNSTNTNNSTAIVANSTAHASNLPAGIGASVSFS
jgi:hypothetical protein